MKNRIEFGSRKTNKGITLIALVITIIVLLILAGISILVLTGENGILNKANTAKDKTDRETAKEEVQLAVMGSYGIDGNLNYEQLKENLDKVEGIVNTPDIITKESFPMEVYVDGYKVTIEENGNVIIQDEKTPNIPKLTTIKQAKEEGKVLDENNPVTIKDKYENKIVVPEGFKIASDSAEDVTGGVVIEDVNHGATAGSQFVWIPVGEIKSENGITKTIELNRYTFDKEGNSIAQGTKVINSYYQELETSNQENTTAKDIQVFKLSVSQNGGYYIGRYEARTKERRTVKTDEKGLGQVTVKKDEYIYNWVTVQQAAKLSKEMYKEDKNFTSDLINSYAWDTAIVFLQTFDDRVNKTKPYSKQSALNLNLLEMGTNYSEDINNQDKICNIWDMASNALELSTENYKDSRCPCVIRGGTYQYTDKYTDTRTSATLTGAGNYSSFRIVIYI